MNKMNFKGKEIETILDILWAIKNDDKHYFYSYGRDCLKSLVKESDSLPPVSEIQLLMEFDVWISARFGQEYKIEESREIMQRFLSSR